jgi:2'-5' RNA ligase
LRLFLALPVPPELARRLGSLQDELASSDWKIRWTPPAKLHLTLHFLGETPENLLEDLHHELGALMHARRPFDLKVGGLGAFPSWEDPKVLWAGVSGPGAVLEELFAASYKILKNYRIFQLRENFTPHLTLGRVTDLSPAWEAGRLKGLLPQWNDLGRLPVEGLRLMRSRPGPADQDYEILQTYQLAH